MIDQNYAKQKGMGQPKILTGFFLLFILIYVFAMFLNEPLGIDYMDEIVVLFLFFYLLKYIFFRKNRKLGLDIKIYGVAVLFYLAYSISISSNGIPYIFLDVFTQSKPYIAFFSVYYTAKQLSSKQKKVISRISILLFITTIFAVLFSLLAVSFEQGISKFFVHPSKFYSALILIGLTYLFVNPKKRSVEIVTLIIFSLGLVSLKGKMFGFYAASILGYIMINKGIKIKFSLKNISALVISLSAIIYAAREKMLFYFLDTSASEHALARPVMYVSSFSVLNDYFPFGSGFASFGTSASSLSYSKIYYQYGLDYVWGLSPEYPEFITDTYYPSLAQFGYVGIILFLLFWLVNIKRLNILSKDIKFTNNYLIGALLLCYIFIESVADAAFTNNRGVYAMFLFALVINDFQQKDEKTTREISKPN